MRVLLLPGPCLKMFMNAFQKAVVVTEMTAIEKLEHHQSSTVYLCPVTRLPELRSNDLIILPAFDHWCRCAGVDVCRKYRLLHARITCDLMTITHLKATVLFMNGQCMSAGKEKAIDSIRTKVNLCKNRILVGDVVNKFNVHRIPT